MGFFEKLFGIDAENTESVRVANQTEIPLVFVVRQVGPLHWKVLQPGERWSKQTGRVWFTLDAFPYDGNNEPTDADVALSILLPTIGILLAVASGEWRSARSVACSFLCVLGSLSGCLRGYFACSWSSGMDLHRSSPSCCSW